MTNQFADKIAARIAQTGSVLCAGFDPTLEQLPPFLREQNNVERFGEIFLEAIAPHAASVKYNVAFFEALGLAGIQTLTRLTARAQQLGLPVIVDAKRGDIGNTASAYARAWLGDDATLVRGDALTVNPFLGFDTLEPFIARCEATGTGLFVLVRTSNPGAAALQEGISGSIAQYLAEQSHRLRGSNGLSALGAVIGATAGDYQLSARSLMPSNLFLIPGYGAQGATAAEAMAGVIGLASESNRGGGSQDLFPAGLVNSSRGLLKDVASCTDAGQLVQRISRNTLEAASDLRFRKLQHEQQG